MANDKSAQLAKLEAQKQTHVAAIAELDTQIAAIRAELRDSVLAAMRQQAQEYGVDPTELFDNLPKTAPAKQKSAKKGAGKARNVVFQDGQGNTWGGGKGPRPKWVKAIQEAGGDMEKYRVAGAAQNLAAQGGKAPNMADIPR